jgi:hypothetical protein
LEHKSNEQRNYKDNKIRSYQPDNHPILPFHEQSKIQGANAEFCCEKADCIQKTAYCANNCQFLDVGKGEEYRMSACAIVGEDAVENGQYYPSVKLVEWFVNGNINIRKP